MYFGPNSFLNAPIIEHERFAARHITCSPRGTEPLTAQKIGGSLGYHSKKTILTFVGLIVMLSGGAESWAATELLVRYREPRNAVNVTGETAQKVEVLQADQRLVKLSFDSASAADSAAESLLQSNEVESVTPNFYYKPTIIYRPKRTPADSFDWLRHLFDGNFSFQGVIPPVLLPTPEETGIDPLVSSDWALNAIHMPQGISFTPSPVTVAVIDTGVDYNHEDLVGGMWRKPGNEAEVGFDFTHKNALPYDVLHFDLAGCLKDFTCSTFGIDDGKYLVNPGHGTHCAGHVGAVANNARGIAGVGALQKAANVMALKIFYDYGDVNAGKGDDAAAIQSIDYAIQNGAKVISASWGARIQRAKAEKSELKKALMRAQQAGILVVVAAGNEAVDQDMDPEPSFPAAYDLDNLIVVAASDRNEQLAEFSHYGARSVHIAAPGVKILSTTVGSQYSDVVARARDSEGQEVGFDWDGTSMSAPLVAGAVALVWSKYPQADYREIRARILDSARRVSQLSGKVASGGILDVAAALGD